MGLYKNEISLENGNPFKPNYYSTSIDVYIVTVYIHITRSITYKQRLSLWLFFSGDQKKCQIDQGECLLYRLCTRDGKFGICSERLLGRDCTSDSSIGAVRCGSWSLAFVSHLIRWNSVSSVQHTPCFRKMKTGIKRQGSEVVHIFKMLNVWNMFGKSSWKWSMFSMTTLEGCFKITPFFPWTLEWRDDTVMKAIQFFIVRWSALVLDSMLTWKLTGCPCLLPCCLSWAFCENDFCR